MSEPRRLFGPTVLAGLAGSGLAAFAGGRPWASPDRTGGTAALVDRSGGHVPLGAALGLVALACWGVLLVTRGVVRRVVAAAGVLGAAGLVATSVLGRASALDSARSATLDLGVTGIGVHTTAWWWVGLLASLVALATAVSAVRLCPHWPEMGSRYDAPAARPSVEDMSEVDLWRAIDQGHDPTDRDH
ncbi:Trp biosynthesis-associated membrane protein [Nocardioides cynanchi]|uniref:Trp biosynthesis-associated membrane protein n=1 Tax=Nocardioides cynanchi TaxID=2558918 RepID=UPI001248832A|nr:Trp biosynthesis-associated membrane protein [Nocardioides cynanchi]